MKIAAISLTAGGGRMLRALWGVFWVYLVGGAVCVMANSGSESSQAGLEEIVVTATRRDTRLAETPISISALSGQDMERDRVLTMLDVAQQVPGLVYIPQSGSETYLSIRGASTLDDSTGTDQGVSMFIDDVVRTSVADLQPDLYDMDRVEVLKGPQGTLYGRNAIGGLISLYTRIPTFKVEASGEVTGGSFGGHALGEIKGMLNVPLVDDRFAMRLVVSRHSNDGYIDDVYLHHYIGNEDLFSTRAKLLFTPSDNWRFLVGFDYLTKTGSSPAIVYGNFEPAIEPNIVYSPTQVSQGDNGRIDQRIYGLTGKIDGKTAVGNLTSITGYRHIRALDEHSESGDPLNAALLTTMERDSQLTEELRLASLAGQDPLSWVVGTYFLHSNKSRPFRVNGNLLPGSFLAFIADRPPPVPYDLEQATRTVSYAGFADATWAMTEQWKLNVGGRYTKEDKNGFTYANPSQHVAGPPASAVYSGSWSAFTPKATVTFQPLPELMTYGTVSRGFQSGGFNAQGVTAEALNTPFKPEYVWNYELGTKFDGLDHRLQANLSIFEDRYSDLQIIEYNGATLTFTTNNAGTGKVDGVEFDISAAPTGWLTVGAKYDYLDAKFTRYVIDNGPINPDGSENYTNNTGNKIPFAARNQFSVNFELHSQLPGAGGRLALGGDDNYRDTTELTAANDTPPAIRGLTAWHGLLNLHASWASSDERYEVVAWGKNVTNLYYATIPLNQSIFVENIDEATAHPEYYLFPTHPGDPRSYGVTFRVRL